MTPSLQFIEGDEFHHHHQPYCLRKNQIVDGSKLRYVTQDIAYLFLKVMQASMTQVLIGSLFALLKAISLWKTRAATASSTFNGTNNQLNLTKRQLELLGIKLKFEHAESKSSKEPPKSIAKASPSKILKTSICNKDRLLYQTKRIRPVVL